MEMHFKLALNDTDLLSGSNEFVLCKLSRGKSVLSINISTTGVNSSPPSAGLGHN